MVYKESLEIKQPTGKSSTYAGTFWIATIIRVALISNTSSGPQQNEPQLQEEPGWGCQRSQPVGFSQPFRILNYCVE